MGRGPAEGHPAQTHLDPSSPSPGHDAQFTQLPMPGPTTAGKPGRLGTPPTEFHPKPFLAPGLGASPDAVFPGGSRWSVKS